MKICVNKYFEAINHYDNYLKTKTWKWFKQLHVKKEEREVAFGESLLIYERVLMKKVMKAVRVINKQTKLKNTQNFNAIAHWEVSLLSRSFNAWREVFNKEKADKQKEKQK